MPASDDDIVSQVQKGCATEIEDFCSQVTLGDGRLLACFYAHEDKITGQCQYALYNAAAQLEHALFRHSIMLPVSVWVMSNYSALMWR